MVCVCVCIQFGGLVNKVASSVTGTTTSDQGDAGASSTSHRMPIVVRDPSQRSSRLQPQDASTVDIHLPSKLTRFPKGMYMYTVEISLFCRRPWDGINCSD